MELLLELFTTAFVAICFSFLVAKLVSIAMLDDAVPPTHLRLNSTKIPDEETIMEEVKFDKGTLEFEGTHSKTRFQFVVKQVIGDVNQLEGEGSFDNSQVSRCFEEFVDKNCQQEETSTSGASQIEGDAFEAVGVMCPEVTPEFFGREEIEESTEGDECRGKMEGEMVNPAVDELIVDEMIENEQSDDVIVEDLATAGACQSGDVRVGEVGDNELNQIDEEKNGLVSENDINDDDDDDWEGIERSELENVFAKAANYVGAGGKDDRLWNLESDVEMQFYGLQKIAMEGPCHEAQPMALKISARAKWNAWRRLGNISPEAAMEQYIALLSTKDPSWRQGDCLAGDSESDSSKSATPGAPGCNLSTFEDTTQSCLMERKQEQMAGNEGDCS